MPLFHQVQKYETRLRKLFILAKTREKKYNGILLAADSQLGAWKISVFRNWKSTIPREDPLLTIVSSRDILRVYKPNQKISTE